MCGSQRTIFLIYIAIALLLDISAILLNGLVAYVLKKHKKTSIISMWFIYCLSISDVMVGITGTLYHSLLLKLKLDSGGLPWSTLITINGKILEYFFATSGHLIFIIAVDRCIHMKYLNKYSRIMTQPRARFIMLLNAIFSSLLIFSLFAVSDKHIPLYYFVLSIFHATFTLVIYTIYLKTYFSIKRQVVALQVGKRGNMLVRQKLDKKLEHQNRSHAQHRSGYSEAKVGVVIASVEKSVLGKGVSVLPSQTELFVLPKISMVDATKLTENREDHDNNRTIAVSSHAMECNAAYKVPDNEIETIKQMEHRQQATMPGLLGVLCQQPLAIKATPEQEFRKAIFLIFLALLICYFPNFIHNFYSFPTKNVNSILLVTSAIAVLLNSSLNAIILITFNKEVRKKVKAIFREG